jgi:transketolase N-terminal domain/subunit
LGKINNLQKQKEVKNKMPAKGFDVITVKSEVAQMIKDLAVKKKKSPPEIVKLAVEKLAKEENKQEGQTS